MLQLYLHGKAIVFTIVCTKEFTWKNPIEWNTYVLILVLQRKNYLGFKLFLFLTDFHQTERSTNKYVHM